MNPDGLAWLGFGGANVVDGLLAELLKWTSTGALPPTGCPCGDCVNKDLPRASRNLGSPSDQYVIQLHAQPYYYLCGITAKY